MGITKADAKFSPIEKEKWNATTLQDLLVQQEELIDRGMTLLVGLIRTHLFLRHLCFTPSLELTASGAKAAIPLRGTTRSQLTQRISSQYRVNHSTRLDHGLLTLP
jgi:hypothetical protein